MPDAEQWYAVYDKVTGDLVSTGTVLANPVPDGLVVTKLDEQPDMGIVEWNVTDHAFEPIPQVENRDRIAEFRENPTIQQALGIVAKANPSLIAEVQDVMSQTFGDVRHL